MTGLTSGQHSNLPAEVTRFIGRRRELPVITAAVGRHRLVTLRGAGGVGKTRLALRASADLVAGFRDGCWLVQLSPVQAAGLPRAISEALGLPDETVGDAPQALAQHLAGRELLLLLDTCEHVTEACASLAALLLRAAPGLRILATSRSPLGLPEEHTVLIGPLGLPAADDAGAEHADAVTLFADRAMATVPGFELTPENIPAVAELCRRLDGIPLALELAAVRLRGMPVTEILARLSDRFRVLGTARTANGRHRTLRAAVSWSYELCTPAEQRLWAELSVFPGAFDLAAAEHACGPGTAVTLRRLTDKSVVQLSPGGTGPESRWHPGSAPADRPAGGAARAGDRYQQLDTMREFGAELLHARPDADRVRARHRDYYLALAERAAGGYLSAGQTAWLDRLQAETTNLRVALDYCFTARGAAGTGLRLNRLLLPYWRMTSQFTEGGRWHERALQVAPHARDDPWAVLGAGVLAVQQGDFAEGGPLVARASELARATTDANLTAQVTDARGMLAFYSGDLATARREFESAIASYELVGFSDPTTLASYAWLAAVCLQLTQLDQAVSLCERCLRHCDDTGEQWARSTALWTRGAARWKAGDNAAAARDALECLQVKGALGDLHAIAMCFDLLAACLADDGDHERAAVLHGAAERLWALLNAPVLQGPGYAQMRASAAEHARRGLTAAGFDALAARGRAMSLAGALAVARGEARESLMAADAAPGPEVKPLTRREREIADLVASGLGNREIAKRLYLSKRTVDSHVEHIFAKLGFSSRTQLATWVLDRSEPA